MSGDVENHQHLARAMYEGMSDDNLSRTYDVLKWRQFNEGPTMELAVHIQTVRLLFSQRKGPK